MPYFSDEPHLRGLEGILLGNDYVYVKGTSIVGCVVRPEDLAFPVAEIVVYYLSFNDLLF